MKTLACVFGLFVLAVGAAGLVAPSSLIWIARRAATPGAFYVVATARVAFGVALVLVAPASRAPKALRIVGYVILVAGLTTALTGRLAMGRARDIIEWWLGQGTGVIRLTGLPLMALGGFVAYACAPDRRSLSR